jgi:hypothetical protein
MLAACQRRASGMPSHFDTGPGAFPPLLRPHETTGTHGFNPTQRRGEVQAIRQRETSIESMPGSAPMPRIGHALPFDPDPAVVPIVPIHGATGTAWLRTPSARHCGTPQCQHPETSIESMPGSAPMPRIEPPSHSIQTPRWSRSPRSTGRQELHGFAPHPRDAAKHRNPDGGKRASSPRAAMRPRRGSGSGSVIPFDANAVRSRPSRFARNHSDRMASSPVRNAARRSNPGIRKRGTPRQRRTHARASAA